MQRKNVLDVLSVEKQVINCVQSGFSKYIVTFLKKIYVVCLKCKSLVVDVRELNFPSFMIFVKNSVLITLPLKALIEIDIQLRACL